MGELELRAKGDFQLSYNRIICNVYGQNDIRVLHTRERYAFLGLQANLLGCEEVIDLCCGFAAGLASVRALAPNVALVGVERDEVACMYNVMKYPHIEMHNMDVMGVSTKVGREERRLVSCLEAIGHMNIPSDTGLLKRMAEIAGSGGHCMLSIGRFEENSQYKPHSYFHRSYSLERLQKLLDYVDVFSSIEWYGQTYPTNRGNIIERYPVRNLDTVNHADFLVVVMGVR